MALLGSKPLLQWTIEVSLSSRMIDETIVSTDDQEIRDFALSAGADAPFLRPTDISTDFSRDIEFFNHYLEWCEKNSRPAGDILVHLRPTVPFRKTEVIDNSIRDFSREPSFSSLRSVNLVQKTPFKMWFMDEDGVGAPVVEVEGIEEGFNAPRQILPNVYEQNCYIDITRRNTILNYGSISGPRIKLVETEKTIDIDSPSDLLRANDLADSGSF